jgi:hypothetical protein
MDANLKFSIVILMIFSLCASIILVFNKPREYPKSKPLNLTMEKVLPQNYTLKEKISEPNKSLEEKAIRALNQTLVLAEEIYQLLK